MMQLDSESVRWLLAHLYDNAALASSPVVAQLPGLSGGDAIGRANSVRRVLLDCIEFLRLARRESLRSLAARSYAVLWLRYVEGMGISRVAEELALGERQTHRELRLAEAKLAEIVAEHLLSLSKETITEELLPGEEMAVAAHLTQVELAQALAAALETVRPLAQTMAVTLQANLEGIAGQVFTDEGIFRQLLIQALSLGIQHAATGKVRLKAVPAGTVVNINIEFARGQSPVDPSMMAPLRQLAGTLNLLCIIDESAEHEVLISLSVPLKQPRSILVVEDSAAATQLYRRYLEPSGDWRVIAVPEPRLAYDMARSIQPALIILDILMPSTDGWTILNLLHAHEDTASIPVIVCSVFQDVLLAKSLGAKAHLRKPVSQVQLLSAVRTWARQTDNPHAH